MNNQKILVAGLGSTGVSILRYLAHIGASQVIAYDDIFILFPLGLMDICDYNTGIGLSSHIKVFFQKRLVVSY